MYLIESNKLVHIDSSADIIEHYGVKGMKWGKRLKSSVSNTYNKYVKTPLSNVYENHKENLRYKYRQKGLSEKEVEERLRKRLRNEKIAAAALATAAAAYGAYKGGRYIKDEYIGITFNKGDKINTVMGNDIDYGRHFYAAGKKDEKLYKNLRGRDLETWGMKPSMVTTEFLSKAQVAPNGVAREEFEKLYKKDTAFRSKVDSMKDRNLMFMLGPKYKNKYDQFNALAPYDQDNSAWEKYKSKINKKGFIGVLDRNDKDYSGYGADSPVILFGQEHKLKRAKITGYNVDNDEYQQVLGDVARKQLIRTFGGPAATVGAGIAGGAAISSYRKNKKLREEDKAYNRKYSGKTL